MVSEKGQFLSQLYRKQGRLELAEAVESIDVAVNKLNYNTSLLWVMNEHRCPICNKAVVDVTECEFMDSTGMCASCDHIISEDR